MGFLVLILCVLLYAVAPSEAAFFGVQGKITPCIPPCTEYALLITPQGQQSCLKLFVYKFKRKKNTILKPRDVTQIETNPSEITYDVEKLLRNSVTINNLVLELVRAAEKVIPRENQISSPIFFSLPPEVKAEYPIGWLKVLNKVNALFTNKTVPFMANSFSVLSDTPYTKGLSQWITVNFLLGKFAKKGVKKTVGVLSFDGNLKSELSFEQNIFDGEVSSLTTIKHFTHLIKTSSFIEGTESLNLKKYFDEISKPKQTETRSPCGPKGLREKFVRKNMEHGYIVGTGDVAECRRLVHKVYLKLCSKLRGCPFLKTPFKGRFVAFDNIAMLMNSLGCYDCDHVLTPSKLDALTRRSCGADEEDFLAEADERTRNSVTETIPAKKYEIHAKNSQIPAKNSQTPAKFSDEEKDTSPGVIDCLNANYLYVLMTEAYHMDKNQEIKIIREINGREMNPALGGILTNMNLLAVV